jgi:MinD superfamily P-loop ATPase
MKVAVASGKGGTGKTTVAVNLAKTISQMGKAVQYVDCDVEEPNGHIFLKPDIREIEKVTIGVPEVDNDLCNGCGKCGQLCQYSAIICVKDKPLVFEQLCHSCGGCMLVCPTGAIKEKQKRIGFFERGSAGNIRFVQGRLEIGDVRTPALIKNVKHKINNEAFAIIDAPPGTSCPVVEAVRDTDFVLLVTEPTPFGLNDLELAVAMVRQLKISFAVAINRNNIGDDGVMRYCQRENIKVLIQIPNDRKIAESYSRGVMIVEAMPDYKQKFIKLYEDIKRLVKGK